MRLRPFFSYYGSKHRIAPRYPVPEYPLIVEPFAGSAAYATLHFQRKVHLYEVSPQVAGVWRYLIGATGAEIRRLPLLPAGACVDDLSVACEEARFLVGFWLNKGVAHACKSAAAWMRSGNFPDQFWGERIRERIASQVEHIRHWRVFEASYLTAPDVAATYFVDPPYRGSRGRRYPYRRVNYLQLSRWCRGRQGQVIACEGAGASWLPFQPHVSTRGLIGYSQEVLWTNTTADPSPAPPLPSGERRDPG